MGGYQRPDVDMMNTDIVVIGEDSELVAMSILRELKSWFGQAIAQGKTVHMMNTHIMVGIGTKKNLEEELRSIPNRLRRIDLED